MKLTIIITCYNNDWCVNEAIDSVKNITFKDWDCIIVNDGSTDKSEEVIKQTIENDNRFRLITTKNKGVAMARNLGLAMATGDYCLFLDSDDLLISEYPERAMRYLTKNENCPLYFGGFKCSGMIKQYVYPKWLGYKNLLLNPCISISAIFKRKHGLEIGGFNKELKAFENYEFWIRYLYHNSDNVKNTPQLMIEYRTRPDSRHFSHNNEELMSELRKIREINKSIYEEYGVR